MKQTHLLLLLFVSLFSNAQHPTDSIATLIRQYDYQAALREIDSIPADSINLQTLYLKATALNGLSRFKEAIACFETLYAADSSNLKIAIELADSYKSVADSKKSLKVYEEALVHHPGNPFLMQLLAGAYFSNTQYDRARLYYSAACRADTSTYLLKQLAACYGKLGAVDSVIYCYEQAIRLDSADYQPVFRLAGVYQDQKKYENGIQITDAYLRNYPDNIDINRLSGYLCFLTHNYPKAVVQFLYCTGLGDTSEFVNKYLGYSYFKLNQSENAILYLEKCLAADSTNAELYYVLGLSYGYIQWDKSVASMNKAAALLSPSVKLTSEVYQDLSEIHTRHKKYEQGLAALVKAWELTPHDTLMLYKVGSYYDTWINDTTLALKFYYNFMATQKPVSASESPSDASVQTASYYIVVENRIHDLLKPPVFPVMAPDTTRVLK